MMDIKRVGSQPSGKGTSRLVYRNPLNVGGFSDAVFSVVASFLADDSGRFVAEVEKIEL